MIYSINCVRYSYVSCRLVKDKQEHEERAKSSTPPILSPSSSSIKSPPPVVEEEGTEEPPQQQQQHNEVIGVGLTFLQRLLLLKSKEEHAQQQQQQQLQQQLSPSTTELSPPPTETTNQKTLKPNKMSLLEGLILQKDNNEVEEVPKNVEQTEDSGEEEKPWSKLKKAAIVRDSDPSTSTTSGVSVVADVTPNLVHTRKTKYYRSIDDLSPEYSGLSFVKKLKILNELQKQEELETVMKTRSFSLDIPDQQTIMETDTLTRSHSEGSTMHQPNSNLLSVPLSPSTESNETLERRRLKSILKKLSEDGTNLPATMPPKIDSMEFRKLMRAPTIEGYAARHSKLAKSVTFNRHTLQSPPNSANLTGTPPNFFPMGNGVGVGEEEKRPELEKCGVQLISTKNQMKSHKGKSYF